MRPANYFLTTSGRTIVARIGLSWITCRVLPDRETSQDHQATRQTSHQQPLIVNRGIHGSQFRRTELSFFDLFVHELTGVLQLCRYWVYDGFLECYLALNRSCRKIFNYHESFQKLITHVYGTSAKPCKMNLRVISFVKSGSIAAADPSLTSLVFF